MEHLEANVSNPMTLKTARGAYVTRNVLNAHFANIAQIRRLRGCDEKLNSE